MEMNRPDDEKGLLNGFPTNGPSWDIDSIAFISVPQKAQCHHSDAKKGELFPVPLVLFCVIGFVLRYKNK